MKDMCHDHMCVLILVNLYHFISMEIRNDGFLCHEHRSYPTLPETGDVSSELALAAP